MNGNQHEIFSFIWNILLLTATTHTRTHTGTLERGIMELMQWSAVDNEADVCLQGWHSRDTHTHTHTLGFLATLLPVPSSPPSSWSFNYPSPDTQRCDASACLYARMCALKVRPRSLGVTQASQGLPFLTGAPSNHSPLLTVHSISSGQSQPTIPASKKPIVLINLFRDPSPLPLLLEWVFFLQHRAPPAPVSLLRLCRAVQECGVFFFSLSFCM